MWLAIFSALTAVICALCLSGCVLIVRNAARVTESQAQEMRSLPSRIESLQESQKLMADELEHLAQRVKMQRVRNATDHGTKSRSVGDLPDAYTNPDEWRAAMNRRLAMQRLGGSK